MGTVGKITPNSYERQTKSVEKVARRPIAGLAPQTAYKRIGEELKALFGLSIVDNTSGEHGSIEEFLREIVGPDGKVCVGSTFRSRLAKLLGISKITNEALNAMFGDQSPDGELDENDYFADLGAFEKRLCELVDVFAVKKNAGESVWSFMRKKYIRFTHKEGVEVYKGSAYRSAFARMARSNDALFTACFKAALEVYLYPGGKFSTSRAEEISKFYTKEGFKNSWNGSMSDKLLSFVLTAYEARFDLQLQTSKIEIDDDIDWEKKDSQGESLYQKFMKGIFADYVFGRGILPKEDGYDEINEESINAVALRRGNRFFSSPPEIGLSWPVPIEQK